MSKQEFFPKKSGVTPTIYAYELPNDTGRKGQPKVGFTNRTAQERIKEQIGATRAEYRIVLEENAMRNDGSVFTDFDVHRYLKQKDIKHTEGEWFECTIKDLKAALIAVKKGELK